ncbi:MAG: penicillin-insensitive murein endopeptidase, partial [Planctomycetota bacterium]
GAGTQYGRIGEIPRDSLRSVISTTGSWSKVSYSGGTGYVHNSYLTDPTSGTLAATKTAAARAVNGTSGPGGSTTPSGTVTTGNPSGLPSSSRGFLQLPASAPGLYSYTVPSRRWGRDYFMYGVLRVGQDWSTTGRPRMGTGDISFANGGPISGHVSHQKGVDIDVRPVCGNERACTRFSSDYSRTGTRTLIGLFRQHTPIKLILFNDTAISGVTTWPNHDNHFHARAHER